MEKFFKLKERGTTVRTEIIAGLTTFMAMAYVLFVIPDMFAEEGYELVSWGAQYIATALSAVIGTVLIGLLANLPLAQASGIGLSAFFVYTVCRGFGFTYANALVFVLADGIIFVILTVTGLRKKILASIPTCVKVAIPAGIGLLIALLGLKNTGLVVYSDGGVGLASFNILGGATWAGMMPLLVLILTVLTIAALSKREVKGAILWSILGGSVLYYALGFTIPGFYTGFFDGITINPLKDFALFGREAFGAVFTEGFNFSHYLSQEGNTVGSLIVSFATTALAFCMVDMFDTIGTLYGACRSGGLLIKNQKGEEEIPGGNRAMLSDAIATCVGSVCGTSTVTSYVESSAGVSAGGRTGLAALVTAGMFLLSMFLSPVARFIPTYAVSAALVYVGVLMMSCVKDLEWGNPESALPAFLTIVMMPFTFNISWGIAFGIVSYVIIKMLMGRFKRVRLGTWILAALFLVMFLLTN